MATQNVLNLLVVVEKWGGLSQFDRRFRLCVLWQRARTKYEQ